MRKTLLLLILVLFGLGACVRDQQAARTRVPGVDKKPDQDEEPKGTDEPS